MMKTLVTYTLAFALIAMISAAPVLAETVYRPGGF